jgi:IS1 family transposase
MNKLDAKTRAQILHLLCEGQSIRATSRLTGASKNTIINLLLLAGAACAAYQDRVLRNLPCQRLQLDEIWSFVYAKHSNLKNAKAAPRDAGDVWTWTAIDADTKLLASFYVGDRTAASAYAFVSDLSERISLRAQITTDGHTAYLSAIDRAFKGDVDYAMLVKVYGADSDAKKPERRYSPGECVGIETKVISGNPDPKHISTSFAERANLTMRMHMRRFTRLTNAFSKRIDSHVCAVALHAMYYNFVRQHQTLRMSPAMAAGVTKKLWDMNDVVKMIETWETVWDRHN